MSPGLCIMVFFNISKPSDWLTLNNSMFWPHGVLMCCVRIWKKQQLLCYTTLTDWFSITEVESVYCAVCTESLYKTDMFQFKALTTLSAAQARLRQTNRWLKNNKLQGTWRDAVMAWSKVLFQHLPLEGWSHRELCQDSELRCDINISWIIINTTTWANLFGALCTSSF